MNTNPNTQLNINKEALQKAIKWALSHDKQLLAKQAKDEHLTAIYRYYGTNTPNPSNHQNNATMDNAAGVSDTAKQIDEQNLSKLDITKSINDTPKELFVKVRFDTDKGKWIKPFYFDGQKYKLGEPNLTQKPLYLPQPIYQGDTVYLVEGEKCVHALLDIGLLATTTGGATTIGKCDLTPLLGCHCILWRDNDDSGHKWQDELITALNGLNISHSVMDIAGVLLPNNQPLADKGDCYDYIYSWYEYGEDDNGIKDMIQALPTITPVNQNSTDNPNDTPNYDYMDNLVEQEQKLKQAIDELARLPELQQLLAIGKVSKHFGIPKDKLTCLVNERKQGDFIPEITPSGEFVDGITLYKELYTLINEHICIEEPYKVAFVLWVIMTYLTDIAEILPIAWITAPEKACGKSTLLGLFGRLVNKPYETVNPSQAVFYRIMEYYKPTLLLDEVDNYLKDNKELLTVINAGYSIHACNIARVNMDKSGAVDNYSVFGARVFSGIGEMNGTFASRAIRFNMKRKGKDDKIKRLNRKTLTKSYTDQVQQRIKQWAVDNTHKVQAVDIPLLDITDRDFDNWYILLQIAHVLGVYDEALQACLSLCHQEKELSLNEQLLMDIREVFNQPRMRSVELLEKLNNDPMMNWQTYNNGQPLTARQLANKLKSFNIKPEKYRFGDSTTKGYELAKFIIIFNKYLPKQIDDDIEIWDTPHIP